MQLNILTLFFLLYAVAAVPVNSTVKNSLAPKGSTTGKGAPQKGCPPCVKKREQHGPVASALLATKSLIGKGDFGQAWSTKFNGQDAVIKVMHTPEAAKVEHEVRCLKAVKQFLGWGRTADSSHFYIVMHNMGKPLLVAAPLADGALDDIHEIRKLQSAAKSHYEKTYHMRHLYVSHRLISHIEDANVCYDYPETLGRRTMYFTRRVDAGRRS
ncbi:hypothetical protein H0H87_000269 [Tephrocybe sp. NHM501043]|nr:hypothetical protein H0H87_000269 [Tephrocybe sp. NHM501043]